MTGVQGTVNGMHNTVTGLRVAVMSRFDRMEERMSQFGDDMTVTMGRADRAHASAENARDELQALSQEVAVLARKQRRLEAQLHDFTKPH